MKWGQKNALKWQETFLSNSGKFHLFLDFFFHLTSPPAKFFVRIQSSVDPVVEPFRPHKLNYQQYTAVLNVLGLCIAKPME